MIKNYTSSVPAENSITKIEKLLIGAGSKQVSKLYDGFGNVSSISFSIPFNNQNLFFQLPADVDAVYKILIANKKQRTVTVEKTTKAQAIRTAWKLQVDWLEIQLAMLEMKQVEIVQLFMPYLHDGTETFYNKLKSGGFKMLTP